MTVPAPLAQYIRPTVCSGLALAASLTYTTPVPMAQETSAPTCRPAGAIVRVPELPEGSGVAVSRSHPQRTWAHNDSGRPTLVALDQNGRAAGQLQLTGARVDDWEAMAIGPCAAGTCLYVGDIGDNDAGRKRITIYRVPEPKGDSSSAPADDAFHATYPDGAHDAETLLVTPTGELFIVTKGDTGPVGVYRFPREVRKGATVELERVAGPRESGDVAAGDRITDGAVSPNGTWVALRTIHDVRLYRAADLLSGNWREVGRVDLKALGEPQGEGIAFAADQTLILVGEGGGKSQPGTFARLTCSF